MKCVEVKALGKVILWMTVAVRGRDIGVRSLRGMCESRKFLLFLCCFCCFNERDCSTSEC